MRLNIESKIEIIAVGSELLTSFFNETNSLYLTQRLNDLGFEVSFKTLVGDDWENLLHVIKEALSRSHLIIATGGLGPTQDDKTREAFAEALERKLIFKKDLLRTIEKRFERRGLKMPAVNKKQAYIIEGAEILENKNGTAPGLWLDTNQNLIVLLPGPPHELKPICEQSIWPRLKKISKLYVFRKVLKIAGLTESKVETLISDLYPKASHANINILAYPGQIEIHLTSHDSKSEKQAESRVLKIEAQILTRLEDNVFSTSGEELEKVVGNLLRHWNKTLAVAESCTGGLLSNRITNVPGSSDYFLQGTVVYSNEAKIDSLGIPLSLIKEHGAVSPKVAAAMAEAIRKKAGASYGLGITGIAGPTGGSPEKQVGLVYIALASEKGTKVKKNIFPGNRKIIKFQSSQKALDMLRRHLQENEKSK
ncbi:MAG: competence/damage-inducible protein A [Candidatus Aminicenantaceae bacterium]